MELSEEEKKAMETLKEVASDDFETLGDDISPKMAQNILNVIDKQQKEIEDLKAITQNYNAIGGETFGDDRIIVCSMKYFDNGYFKKNYIFKDKIREKIKELEKEIHVVMPNEYNKMEQIIEFKNEGALNVLQELLEGD